MNYYQSRTLLRLLLLLLAPAVAAACTEEVGLDDLAETAGSSATQGGAWAALYASSTFEMCKDCHAPGALGKTAGTEATQNWSTADTAFTSLKGRASGLIGNFAGCNGVPLVGTTSDTSLLVAVFDSSVRANFMVAGFPACNASAIADETLRVGPVPTGTLNDLKQFIDDGGFR